MTIGLNSAIDQSINLIVAVLILVTEKSESYDMAWSSVST